MSNFIVIFGSKYYDVGNPENFNGCKILVRVAKDKKSKLRALLAPNIKILNAFNHP